MSRTFLDTNVFLYAFLNQDVGKKSVAAESAGCDEILTEDLNDGQMYGSVKAVNPFKGL